MASYIARRKFLATLGGAAAAWPFKAHAQQAQQMRRVGVLMSLAADDAHVATVIPAAPQRDIIREDRS